MARKMLTYEDLAERWNVKVGTLRYWVMEKRLKPIKLGRLVRFPESYVNEIEKGGLLYANKTMA